MKEFNLVYALSSRERTKGMLKNYRNVFFKDCLDQWMERKSLCSEKDFIDSLKFAGTTKEEFSVGIKPLQKNDKEILYECLKKKEWYLLNQEVFSQEEIILLENEEKDFSFSIRYYIKYFENLIINNKSNLFLIDQNSRALFLQHLTKDLLSISIKTFVSDLHKQKKEVGFVGETSEQRFQYYLNTRFGSKQSIYDFLCEYPVLFRLFSERLQFNICNYLQFVKSIETSLKSIERVFKVAAPFNLKIENLEAGDSHSKGKSVILFMINEKKLVFKYKNLEIGERFNQFLSILEKKTGSSFYKIDRIYEKNYTIEEFIENESCSSEDEVIDYYYRFGEFTAICYFLCGNDFHAENIVAKGCFPVLIDIETLLQNDNPLKEKDSAYSIAHLKKMQTVLSTSLLPGKYFSNRLEPKNEGASDGVQMSGFNGNGQQLPFKVFQLVEVNTDNVHYDYVEENMKPFQNIPKINGNEVKPENYADFVIQGFSKQYFYFMNHKEELINEVEKTFAGISVRNVLKATQQYLDMLNYSYHPNCMVDYLEREKLFENLWGFNYENKEVVLHEINDLLVNDVPIFFNEVSNETLITGSEVMLNSYYKRSALNRVTNRIFNLDKKDFYYQIVLMKTSLGIYKGDHITLPSSLTPQEHLHRVVDLIMERKISDTQEVNTAFQDFIFDNDSIDYGNLGNDFYSGISGIYTFLLYYNEFYSDIRVKNTLKSLENTLFGQISKQFLGFSVYTGNTSLLIPLYHRINLFNNENDINKALEITTLLQKSQQENVLKVDWISGVSGLIVVLCRLYEVTNKKEFLTFAIELASKINLANIELCGLSHGYSGIAIALNSLNKFVKNTKYNRLIKDCIENERLYFDGHVWKDLRAGKNAMVQWCHGCTGIGLSRLHLIESNHKDANLLKELEVCVDNVLNANLDTDGLCHGNMGNYSFLVKVLHSQKIDTKRQKKIKKKLIEIENKILLTGMTVDGMTEFPHLGFMNGISGVGYEWLRKIVDYEIPDILILE